MSLPTLLCLTFCLVCLTSCSFSSLTPLYFPFFLCVLPSCLTTIWSLTASDIHTAGWRVWEVGWAISPSDQHAHRDFLHNISSNNIDPLGQLFQCSSCICVPSARVCVISSPTSSPQDRENGRRKCQDDQHQPSTFLPKKNTRKNVISSSSCEQ